MLMNGNYINHSRTAVEPESRLRNNGINCKQLDLGGGWTGPLRVGEFFASRLRPLIPYNRTPRRPLSLTFQLKETTCNTDSKCFLLIYDSELNEVPGDLIEIIRGKFSH
ncbi:hypothetical protein AALO_G00068940 [Alosa alosa]|uniref:Uncharacterized protein n=1 Tax=Alosa alosa TaxID=278164 RepID=A0AAV6H1L2_9TELE|nr:hypothetical protein AALO_G00068940 [Alosa alosa]